MLLGFISKSQDALFGDWNYIGGTTSNIKEAVVHTNTEDISKFTDYPSFISDKNLNISFYVKSDITIQIKISMQMFGTDVNDIAITKYPQLAGNQLASNHIYKSGANIKVIPGNEWVLVTLTKNMNTDGPMTLFKTITEWRTRVVFSDANEGSVVGKIWLKDFDVRWAGSLDNELKDILYTSEAAHWINKIDTNDSWTFGYESSTISEIVVPTGRRLREIAEDKFVYNRVYIGAASHGKLFGTNSLKILNREFNYITPANDFKQTYIHSEPGVWKWTLPDQWVDSSKLNGQLIRMHSPISPQASKWAKDDSRTAEELETNMTEYMTELCNHYNSEPEIEWMDVVNETVSRDGTWFGPREGTDKWENPWPLIGYDQTNDGLNPPSYIRLAFEIANQQAPDIKLVYNQHGDMEEAMWDKVKQTIFYLRSLGLRVDGVGWQAHLETDFLDDPSNISKLDALIDWAHANDLEFHVTENDVDILAGDNWEDQATVFSTVLKTIVDKGINGVVTWNSWMVKDDDGQGSLGLPTLFNSNSEPKPAYYAVQKVLEEVNHEAELIVNVIGNGSVSPNNKKALRNSTLELVAIPGDGYAFCRWEGDIISQGNPLSLIMDSNKSVAAIFIAGGSTTISTTVSDITCFGAADGAIDITVSGGSEPYTISWSSGQETEDISGLSAGEYTVTVTDAAACIATATININEPAQLIVSGVNTNSTNLTGNGAIDVTVAGGTTPYAFAWNSGEFTEDISGLLAGTYIVTVTDDNACAISSSFEIGGITALEFGSEIGISFYPNPASNYLNINNNNKGRADYLLMDVNGRMVKHGKLKGEVTTVRIIDLPKGQYLLMLNYGDINIVGQLIKE